MPNILYPLIGKVVLEKNKDTHTATLLLIEQGEMSSIQFDDTLLDLVTFLAYVSEPAQLVRYRLGVFVIGFLSIFLFVAYRLKRVYWRRLEN
jgi:ubiquinol-cytochrome c reductase cytochrome c1 subunit